MWEKREQSQARGWCGWQGGKSRQRLDDRVVGVKEHGFGAAVDVRSVRRTHCNMYAMREYLAVRVMIGRLLGHDRTMLGEILHEFEARTLCSHFVSILFTHFASFVGNVNDASR
jgi:hypothetical protein